MPKTNEAFVLHEINHVEYEKRKFDDEALGENDVIVCPKKTGLCGSDAHFLTHGRIGDFVVEKPMVLGHESAGVVYKVGKNVTSLKVGDRVSMEPGESCMQCEPCKAGHYNLCRDMKFAATPPYDGTLQRFYTLPAHLCYALPPSVSLSEGALIEPLSVAVMAVSLIGHMPHAANVLVFGAGPVGLLCLAVAKALGARRTIAVDIQDKRLEFARTYAATDIFKSLSRGTGDDGAPETMPAYARRQGAAILAQTGLPLLGDGSIQLVVDCTGAEPCIQTAIYAAGYNATVVQVGMGTDNVTIPITTLLSKQISLKGSFRYKEGCYRLALDLVARGLVDLKPLMTHSYPFTKAEEAFQANIAGKSADGKTLIKAIVDGPEGDVEETA